MHFIYSNKKAFGWCALVERCHDVHRGRGDVVFVPVHKSDV